jgi:hypothetical protein
VGGESKNEREELGGEEDGGREGGASARMGCGGGSIGIEGDVLGNKRKDMSSTEKAVEEGRR